MDQSLEELAVAAEHARDAYLWSGAVNVARPTYDEEVKARAAARIERDRLERAWVAAERAFRDAAAST